MDFSLNGGVLIIGSLLWDTNEQRINWRNTCLKVNELIPIPSPIRYGRISKERYCTFSMVFSNECNAPKLKGTGMFLPFINNPINLEKIKTHSEELIKSEQKKTTLKDDSNNWNWGTLTICINPEILKKTSEKYEQAKSFLTYWSAKYANEFNPEHYKVGNELPILNKQGVLQFDWTDELNDYDFIIATATKPNVENYPTSKNIAERMIINEYKEYFNENLNCGISTFQDKEIKKILEPNVNA